MTDDRRPVQRGLRMRTAEQCARDIQSNLTFIERFRELAGIGVRDVEMPQRLGLTPCSMLRMMQREGLEPSQLLREIAWDQKRRSMGEVAS